MLWAGSSSASASSAPATVAWGAKSPPMASNAIRAKVRLPWLRLAAHPRNTRIQRTRDEGASSPGSGDISGSRSPARSCACCGRASSAWMFCASGRPWSGRKRIRTGTTQPCPPRSLCNVAQRGSAADEAHSQGPRLSSAPHVGHSPLQSSRHNAKPGTFNNHCSRTAGRRSNAGERSSSTNTSGSSSTPSESASAKIRCASSAT